MARSCGELGVLARSAPASSFVKDLLVVKLALGMTQCSLLDACAVVGTGYRILHLNYVVLPSLTVHSSGARSRRPAPPSAIEAVDSCSQPLKLRPVSYCAYRDTPSFFSRSIRCT